MVLGCPAEVDGLEPAGSPRNDQNRPKMTNIGDFCHGPKSPGKPKFGAFEGGWGLPRLFMIELRSIRELVGPQ